VLPGKLPCHPHPTSKAGTKAAPSLLPHSSQHWVGVGASRPSGVTLGQVTGGDLAHVVQVAQVGQVGLDHRVAVATVGQGAVVTVGQVAATVGQVAATVGQVAGQVTVTRPR
jgi:hypothetical protein